MYRTRISYHVQAVPQAISVGTSLLLSEEPRNPATRELRRGELCVIGNDSQNSRESAYIDLYVGSVQGFAREGCFVPVILTIHRSNKCPMATEYILGDYGIVDDMELLNVK